MERMSCTGLEVDLDLGVAALHTALDQLLGRDLNRDTDPELLDLWVAVEGFRNRLATFDHALIAQVEARGLPFQHGATSPVVFTRNLLRIGIGEAKARAKAAEPAGPRAGLTGEALPPIYGAAAAAQHDGAIGPAAAAVIVRTVDRLPDGAPTEQVEIDLVGHARTLDVDALNKAAELIRYCYDQDGQYADAKHRDRTRDFTLHQRPDGSVHGSFEGTAEFGEQLQGLFDALAAPAPEVDGVKDPRTAGQRRHDALLDALKMLIRAEQLPSAAGVTTTIIVT